MHSCPEPSDDNEILKPHAKFCRYHWPDRSKVQKNMQVRSANLMYGHVRIRSFNSVIWLGWRELSRSENLIHWAKKIEVRIGAKWLGPNIVLSNKNTSLVRVPEALLHLAAWMTSKQNETSKRTCIFLVQPRFNCHGKIPSWIFFLPQGADHCLLCRCRGQTREKSWRDEHKPRRFNRISMLPMCSINMGVRIEKGESTETNFDVALTYSALKKTRV